MGKDKRKGKKKSNAFDYAYGSGKVGDLMDRYGVSGTRSLHPDMRGPGGESNRTREDVDRDIAKAMMNDYDTRRGMEAAAMAGDKDAAKFAKKGFKAGNIYSAWDKLKSLKKEHVGGGGMNGAKNIAGLTQALVQHDRDTFIEANDAKYATKDELSALEQMKAAQGGDKEETKELSKDIKDAQDRNALYMKLGGNIGGNPYGGGSDANESDYWSIGADDEQGTSAVSPDDADPYTKSQSYLDNYKEKLKSKGKFVSTF